MTKNTRIVTKAALILEDFLEEEGITKATFIQRVGMKSRTTFYRYLSGERRPCEEFMRKMVEETRGRLQPNHFYDINII